jgi:radical SAM superfamily enzyme YgiQ (UPF0313 family)
METTVTTARAKRGKVVFVEPRGVHANVFARFMNIPMLGPLYLGTIARQAGYNVTILNENILGRSVLARELAEADVLCVSCMTATVQRGKAIAKQYKALRTQAGQASRTLIGGIHASMIPEDVVAHFDQVFVGEAETRILDVLAGRITDRIIYGERLEDLDSTPIPDFHLLKDHHKIEKKPIMTSRGCPYDCTFCSVTEMFGRKYRTKSVARVMEEIAAYQSDRLFFVDDHFVVNKRRTEAILDGIQALDTKIAWSCQLRTEASKDPDLVARMRAAGCRMVYIGFESINPEALKQVHKGQSVADIKRSIHVFKQNRIDVHGMFMFGMDADLPGSFKSTSDFCRKSGLTTVQYLALTPLPGTHFYRQMETKARLLHKDWQYYDVMHVVFRPKHMTPIQLQEGLIACFSDFYSYLNACNEAISLAWDTASTLFRRLYTEVYFPSVFGTLYKALGKHIVRSWVSHNQTYLAYLKQISQPVQDMDSVMIEGVHQR